MNNIRKILEMILLWPSLDGDEGIQLLDAVVNLQCMINHRALSNFMVCKHTKFLYFRSLFFSGPDDGSDWLIWECGCPKIFTRFEDLSPS